MKKYAVFAILFLTLMFCIGATRGISPRATGEGRLGRSDNWWGAIYSNTYYIASTSIKIYEDGGEMFLQDGTITTPVSLESAVQGGGDIVGRTEETAITSGDMLVFYDATATANRKIDLDDLRTALTPTWIGSHNGSANVAITGQPGWGGTTADGGWSAVPTTTTADVARTVTHNTGWSVDDYYPVLQIKLVSSGSIFQFGVSSISLIDGTNVVGAFTGSQSTTTLSVTFKRYRVGTMNWAAADWQYRVILVKYK